MKTCFLIAGAAALWLPQPALACSGPQCALHGGLVGTRGPDADELTLPVNAPALRFMAEDERTFGQTKPALAVEIALSDENGDTPLTVEQTQGPDYVDFAWKEKLEVGSFLTSSLKASYENGSSDPAFNKCELGSEGSWKVTEFAPLPKTLGKLRIVPELEPAHVGGGAGCDDLAPASSVRIHVELSNGAQPWADVLSYETWVDGKRWDPLVSLVLGADADVAKPVVYVPGGSLLTEERGSDIVYALCNPSDYPEAQALLEPGSHSVEMRAALPGTDLVLTSDRATFELAACTGDEPSDQGPPPDAGMPGEPFHPEGAEGDDAAKGGPAADTDDTAQAKSKSGACSTSHQSSRGRLAAPFFGLLGLLLRRRLRALA